MVISIFLNSLHFLPVLPLSDLTIPIFQYFRFNKYIILSTCLNIQVLACEYGEMPKHLYVRLNEYIHINALM